MSRMLSLAHLTAIDLAPPQLIRSAAAAGFDAVGLRLIRVTDTSPGYPLMTDRAMMQATKAAMNETGLKVHDIEFVKIDPEIEIAALDAFLDAGAELGAHQVVSAPYDPDLNRLVDHLGALAEMASKRGLGISVEFFPWTTVPNLAAAIDVVNHAGPNIGILVDSLHFDRSGSSLRQLASVPHDRLHFAHICDAPVHPPYSKDDLLHTARAERLPPGEGQIDLSGFIAALPPDLPLGVEVPMNGLAATMGLDVVIARAMAGTRALLDATDVSGA